MSRQRTPLDPLRALTPKERLIVIELMKDQPDKVIASRLHCSTRTVNAHFRRLIHKLDVGSRTGIVLRVLGILH
jgi:DNA-binding NarL/FixJ family response regulator